ncbi:MAG: hypothetical protein K0R08_808 [Solimicrobium sp.]|jgi:hypothetical protein|nr:hypothetical protein [Solimicrobium sp.]
MESIGSGCMSKLIASITKSAKNQNDSTSIEEIRMLMGNTPYDDNSSITNNVVRAINNGTFSTVEPVLLKGLCFEETVEIPENVVLVKCEVHKGKVSFYKGVLTASYNGPPIQNFDGAVAEALSTDAHPFAVSSGAQAVASAAGVIATTDGGRAIAAVSGASAVANSGIAFARAPNSVAIARGWGNAVAEIAGARAEAVTDNSTAMATANGASAYAKAEGASAEASVSGARAIADHSGATATAQSGAVAIATAVGAMATAGNGSAAAATVYGAVVMPENSGARIIPFETVHRGANSNSVLNRAGQIRAKYYGKGGLHDVFVNQKPSNEQIHEINLFINTHQSTLMSPEGLIIECDQGTATLFFSQGVDYISFEEFEATAKTEWCLLTQGNNTYNLITATTVGDLLRAGSTHPFTQKELSQDDIVRGQALLNLFQPHK